MDMLCAVLAHESTFTRCSKAVTYLYATLKRPQYRSYISIELGVG